jgi:hypothetical protein
MPHWGIAATAVLAGVSIGINVKEAARPIAQTLPLRLGHARKTLISIARFAGVTLAVALIHNVLLVPIL